jgi:hypothetical protein
MIHKKVLEWQAAHPNITGSAGVSFGRPFWQFCSGRGRADRILAAMQSLRRMGDMGAEAIGNINPVGRLADEALVGATRPKLPMDTGFLWHPPDQPRSS